LWLSDAQKKMDKFQTKQTNKQAGAKTDKTQTRVEFFDGDLVFLAGCWVVLFSTTQLPYFSRK
jgi:hypothetical protein